MTTHVAALRTAPPPAANRRLSIVPLGAAAFAILIGAGALFGYVAEIDFLRRIGAGGPAVNPLAAAALLLAALAAMPMETRTSQQWQLGASGLLTLIALIAIADHLFGGVLNASGSLFAGMVEADLAEGRRNIFGASTALCLMALVVAQLLRARGRILAAQVVALVALVPPLVALIGLVYGRTALTGAMPAALAIGIGALSASLLARDPKFGLMGVLANRRSSGLLARMLLPAAVAAPFLLDWIFLAGQRWGLLPHETSLALYVGTGIAVGVGLLIYALSEIDRIDRRRRRAEWRLSFEADHDTLTGALNRKSFFAAIDAAIAARNGFTLLHVDLDDFKAINAKYGQAAGDDILRFAAQRMLGILRPTDLLARMNGNSFGILVPTADLRIAREIAARVQTALERPFQIELERAHIGCAIGAVVSGPGERKTTSAELVTQAEEALAAAQRAAGGRVEVRALAA